MSVKSFKTFDLGLNVKQLFTSVFYKKARGFVPGRPVMPSLMLAGKAWQGQTL